MKKLDRLRREIDMLDSKILKLLNKRFEIVHKVGLLKKNNGKEIRDLKREEEVLKRLIEENCKNQNQLTAEHVRAIYHSIMLCAKHAEIMKEENIT